MIIERMLFAIIFVVLQIKIIFIYYLIVVVILLILSKLVVAALCLHELLLLQFNELLVLVSRLEEGLEQELLLFL